MRKMADMTEHGVGMAHRQSADFFSTEDDGVSRPSLSRRMYPETSLAPRPPSTMQFNKLQVDEFEEEVY